MKAKQRKKSPQPQRAAGRDSGPQDKELDSVLTEVTAQPETRHLEEWVQVPCPYCAEEFEVHVTSEDDGQTMIQDCQVCCRPVSLHIRTEDDELQVEAYRS